MKAFLDAYLEYHKMLLCGASRNIATIGGVVYMYMYATFLTGIDRLSNPLISNSA